MRSVIETIKEKLNASSFVKYSEEVRIVDFVIEIADSTSVSKKVLRECLLSFPTRDDVEITITNEADDVFRFLRIQISMRWIGIFLMMMQ